MKALLIYPRCLSSFWGFETVLSFVSAKAPFEPLGLLILGAMFPEEWEIRLVDENVRKISDDDIKWADIVCISFSMLIQDIEKVQKIVDRCKSFNKIVVGGGSAFTTSYKEFSNVDHFILGETEDIFPTFLRDLKEGKAKNIYEPFAHPSLSKTPIPRWDLINFKDYTAMSVQYTRGCPFDCDFCNVTAMHGRKLRFKSIKQIIAELQSLYNTGFRGGVFFADDNFIGNIKEVKRMLKSLIIWQKEHDYPFHFLTQASVNLAEDSELMNLMTEANFEKVFLGIETPNIASLEECGKKQNLRLDLAEAVKTIQEHGLWAMGGMIVGFDNDTYTIFGLIRKWIQNTGMPIAMVSMLGAYPGTKFYDRMKREGRLLSKIGGDNTGNELNFSPKMGKDVLISGYKKLIAEIYSPKGYYIRVSNFIASYRPKVKKRKSKLELKAFLMSMWRIGIFSRFNILYWRLLIKAFFKNIKTFHAVVELCILGISLQISADKVSK